MRVLEPPTYSLGSRDDRVASENPQGLTATTPDASPYASPSDAENAHSAAAESRQDDAGEGGAGTPLDLLTPDLERLAAELQARLSPDDCHRLAELLTAARWDGVEG